MLKVPHGFKLRTNGVRLDSWLTPQGEPHWHAHGQMVEVVILTGSLQAWTDWKQSIETSPHAYKDFTEVRPWTSTL